MPYGEMIRTERDARGMSRFKLATVIGVSPSAIQYWETGDRNPKMEARVKLGRLFGKMEQFVPELAA